MGVICCLTAAVYLPLYDNLAVHSRRWGIQLRGVGSEGALLDIIGGVLADAGPLWWPVWSVAVASAGLGSLLWDRSTRAAALLVAAILVVPFTVNLLAGQAGPSRVYLFELPFALLLLGHGCAWAGGRLGALMKFGGARSRHIGVGVVACITIGTFLGPPVWRAPTDSRHREAGEFIQRETSGGGSRCYSLYHGFDRRLLCRGMARGTGPISI